MPRSRKKPAFICKATSALANAAIVYTLKRLEKKKAESEIDEEEFERKLTVLAIVYHAIGIFYNE